MQSPRIGLVFWLRQCDKENHGWREGPPLTVVLAREFRSVEGLHPPGIFNSNEKRILPSAVIRKRMLWGLAGILPFYCPGVQSEPTDKFTRRWLHEDNSARGLYVSTVGIEA
jgi:hypothetical protein